MSCVLPLLISVLTVIGGITLFKSAYNADSQQVKESESGRGTRYKQML